MGWEIVIKLIFIILDPLVLTTSGKKIKAQEGKVIIFPSNVRHHVPKNRCDGRITLAGNIFVFSDL